MRFSISGYRCLSLELELEDFLVVVGPNGSGKSSLLEALYLAASRGSATPPAYQSPLRTVIASRGMPYSPDVASDAAKLNDVEISRKECAPGLDAELNKVQQGYALQSFLGFLVKLSGVPVSEASFRELGRAYMCGPEGRSAVSVYVNFILDVVQGDRERVALITPRLATDLDYVSSLIDHVALENPEWYAEILSKFRELKVRDVRNINGIPHVIADRAIPLSLAPAGLAYALAISLALGAGKLVFIDEPEAHMHPALIDVVRDVMELALDRGVKVAIATQSIEVLDKTALMGRGAVVQMKDCKIIDVIEMEEAVKRINELYEDLRYF
ncbi:AAA family ATPase [Pyrobaculum aerophilum]|uniref:AAA+ ATPase domain-containing protein n=2 Tax=Pyrobaculum aerophilum TaxID=13773 RepID=A0A371R1K8_9CREN|nr:ATP-binding protein [Pyrobaculum aerophilum]RFA97304.1 hypothetical protein CGL52_09530 [Pyrobaculum aerophilum]